MRTAAVLLAAVGLAVGLAGGACDDAVLVTANEFCKARLGCELPIARAR